MGNLNILEKYEEQKDLEISIWALGSKNLLKQKCLKLMKGKSGGGFYVRYLQDDATKIGWLQLIIEYPDSTCRAVLLYKNQFKESDFDSDGVWTEKKLNANCVPAWRSEKVMDPYVLEKYASPDMPIPGQGLWNKICENYESIPVVKINHTATLGEVYGELVTWAMECATVKGYEFMNGKDRCFLPKAVFDQIAEENNFKVNELKNTFDLMGLFIKDKGTPGFQFSKKVDNETKRFYVLRKNIVPELSKKNEITECENSDFETTVITLQDQERQRFEAYAKRVSDTVSKDSVSNQELLQLLV